jgi:hypothetical protein
VDLLTWPVDLSCISETMIFYDVFKKIRKFTHSVKILALLSVFLWCLWMAKEFPNWGFPAIWLLWTAGWSPRVGECSIQSLQRAQTHVALIVVRFWPNLECVNDKFNETPSSRSWVVTCVQTDWQSDFNTRYIGQRTRLKIEQKCVYHICTYISTICLSDSLCGCCGM